MKFSLGWAIGVLVCCMAVLVLYMYTSSDEDAEQKPKQSNAQPRGGENRRLTANDVNMFAADVDNDGYTSMTRDWTLRSCPLTPSDECVRLLEQSGLKFGDCDDRSASVHPGAPELADGKDNDCDGKLGPGECFRDDDCPRPESLPHEYLWGCSEENGTTGQCTSCEEGLDRDGYCRNHEQNCNDGLDGDADLLIDKVDPDCANSPP